MHKKVIDHARGWLTIESEDLRNPSYEWFGCENDEELGREIEDIATAEGIDLYPSPSGRRATSHYGQRDDFIYCEGVDLVALECVLSIMFFG